MKTLKLYGYRCGEEKATLVEEITSLQLHEWLENKREGTVGPQLCGCDMWEQLFLTKEGIFELWYFTSSEVPKHFEILRSYMREGATSFEIEEYSSKTCMLTVGNRRAEFMLDGNTIRYILR